MTNDDPVAALVLAAAGGHSPAWDELVERFAPLVWSVCMRYRLAPQDAADVSQNVWLRLTQRMDSLREPAALAGWLVTTTRHECLHTFRGRRREVLSEAVIDAVDDSPRSDPAHDLLAQERREALLAAFAELPAQARSLLAMLMADPPASYREISERLGIPVGSIGPTRARWLQRLRDSPALAGIAPTDPAMTRKGETR